MMPTAMVTGCSQGVGLGIAKVFLKQGWRVLGVDQKPAPEATGSSERYAHVVADLRDVAACEAAVTNCMDRFGQLDALANNAGLGNARSFLETSDDDYERDYAINVRPVLRLCRLCLRRREGERGPEAADTCFPGREGRRFPRVLSETNIATGRLCRSAERQPCLGLNPCRERRDRWLRSP